MCSKFVSLTLLLFACSMLQSAQLPKKYPELPFKTELEKAVIESDLFSKNILPPVLKSIITDYADNELHGNMFITARCIGGPLWKTVLWFRQQFEREHPEFAQELYANDDLMVNIMTFMAGGPSSTLPLPDGIKLPSHISLARIRNKNEGDLVQFRIGGVPVSVTCAQKFLTDYDENGEKIFKNFETKLEELLQDRQKKLDYDREMGRHD